MAVRHGYGKIAGADALVFAYDTGDTRNSYRGEPTTNIATLDLSNTSKWYSEGGTKVLQSETLDGYPVYQFRSLGSTIYVSPIAFNQVAATTNDVTLSAYFKNTGTSAQTVNVFLANDFSTDSNGDPNNRSIPADGKWYRQSWTRYAAANTYNQVEFRTFSDTLLISKPQVEYKRHATQPVEGTRSATQGLLDLTGNSSINLSNVSFDSNAAMIFDGTDDYVDLSSATSLLNLGSTFSIEGILKLSNTSQEFGTVFSSLDVATGTQTKGVGFYWKKTAEYGMSANTIRLQLGLSAWSWHIFASNGISISDTNYHHVVVTLTGGNTNYPTIVFYIDGVAQSATKWTAGSIGPINNSSNANSLRLGSIYTASNSSYNNFYSAESLNVVKIYNRVLTAAEVRNNFNFYKGRFGM